MDVSEVAVISAHESRLAYNSQLVVRSLGNLADSFLCSECRVVGGFGGEGAVVTDMQRQEDGRLKRTNKFLEAKKIEFRACCSS